MGKQVKPKPRRSSKLKKRVNYLHAKRRMEERFGVELTRIKSDQLKKKIMAGMVTDRKRLSGTRSSMVVQFEQKFLKIVWDRKKKSIITVLIPKLPLDTQVSQVI